MQPPNRGGGGGLPGMTMPQQLHHQHQQQQYYTPTPPPLNHHFSPIPSTSRVPQPPSQTVIKDEDGQPPAKKVKPSPSGTTGGVKRKSLTKDDSKGKEKGKDKDGKEKEKKTRSRAACLSCKSTKQRCDGPSQIPCRRCMLYGLECKFPSSANVNFSTLSTSTSTTSVGGVGGNGGGDLLASLGLGNQQIPPADAGIVTQKLFEISSRLASIESVLRSPSSRPHYPSAPSTSSHRSLEEQEHEEGTSPTASMEAEAESEEAENTNNANPLQFVLDHVDQAVGPELGGRTMPSLPEDFGFPDVLNRNILTAKECQELFDFFFGGIHPWIMMLSLDTDRDAMAVRAKSSLLFHTILLLASSYSTPFPSHLHATLVTYTNAIFAPHILSPQPHELTTDFLRAVDLLNLYKPTQFGARRAEGKNDAESMRASKVNGLASWMLQGILGRTAERLELSSVLNKFARAYSAVSGSGGEERKEIPHDVARDLRLYYWLLSNDVHGNVQSGRRCNMEGASALTTTRLFSSLQLQPYDTRLAASVEMFENARPILRSVAFEKFRRIGRSELERFNLGMAAWEEFWVPVLISKLNVDPLAMTVLCPFGWFIVLTYNACAYHSWQTNRMHTSDSGNGSGDGEFRNSGRRIRTEGPRDLAAWEFEALQRAVTAGEGLIFSLCEESRVKGAWRQTQWKEAERADGWRKLVLDQTVVETCSWGMDAITCVAWVFPAVFLCRLANEGILTEDLVLLSSPTAQPPWRAPRKLPRLLELAASFLDAIALNPHHPAKLQARAIRSLLDAGVRGLPALKPLSKLPRNAAILLSPAATPSTLFPASNENEGLGGPSHSGAGQGGRRASANNNSNGWEASTSESTNNALAQWQLEQQRQQEEQARQLLQLSQMSSANTLGSNVGNSSIRSNNIAAAVPGGPSPELDQSLNGVLDRFDPALFGDTSSFWEWGGLGGGAQVDWGAVGAGLNSS